MWDKMCAGMCGGILGLLACPQAVTNLDAGDWDDLGSPSALSGLSIAFRWALSAIIAFGDTSSMEAGVRAIWDDVSAALELIARLLEAGKATAFAQAFSFTELPDMLVLLLVSCTSES
jgi:hypothetical protein